MTRMRIVAPAGVRAGTLQGGEAEGGALQRDRKVLDTGGAGPIGRRVRGGVRSEGGSNRF